MKLALPKFSLPQLRASLLSYLKVDIKSDAIAGLTVAVMGVPQAMAYALIAGLPPVWGLYTAIVTCTVAAVLGSSSHLVTGPTNALCMVVLSLTAHLPAKYGYGLLEIALLLTFLTGLVQTLFGLLKLGGIIRYVSHSVVIGFTAGAGILIAISGRKKIKRFRPGRIVGGTARVVGGIVPVGDPLGDVAGQVQDPFGGGPGPGRVGSSTGSPHVWHGVEA